MQVISGTHENSIGWYIAGYFTRNTGYIITAPFTAMGWIENNECIGQAIFSDFTGSNIEIHIYGPGALRVKSLRQVLRYVFIQCGCNRLTAKPYVTNKILIPLLIRLGFKYEGILRNYYPPIEAPIDAKVYRLDKDIGLRWLNNAQSPKAAFRT